MKLALPLVVLLAARLGARRAAMAVEAGPDAGFVDAAEFSAFSHGLSGELDEQDDGSIHLVLRVPLDSLTTGDAGQDRAVRAKASWRSKPAAAGRATRTSTSRGRSPSREVGQADPDRLAVTRSETVIGHAVLNVHLRELGVAVPPAARDLARIEVDTALRRDRTLASRE